MPIDLFVVSTPTLAAALAGLALGGFFFGSLWWAVRRTLSATAATPSVLSHLGILVLRLAITLLGFYAVGAGHWQRLLACLAGFLVARMVVTRLTQAWARRQPGPTAPAGLRQPPEPDHAPQP